MRLLLALQLHLFTSIVDRACPSLLYAQVGVFFFVMTLMAGAVSTFGLFVAPYSKVFLGLDTHDQSVCQREVTWSLGYVVD